MLTGSAYNYGASMFAQSPLPLPTPTDTPAEFVAVTFDVTAAVLAIGLSAFAALVVHIGLVRLVFRYRFRGTATDRLATELRKRCRWPSRVTSMFVGAQIGRQAAAIEGNVNDLVAQVLLIGIIVAVAWWAIEAAAAVEVTIIAGSDLEPVDNQAARQSVTRAVILRRAVTVLVVIVAASATLLTFDSARAVGASLLASAGVLSIIAGVAAQSTLGNLVAGVQIAFAETVRLDDVVVVEGQWGRIEGIGLTTVVVQTWDRRRVILPTSFFTTTPFENWTRDTSQIVGQITWHLDHRTDVAAMREVFLEHVANNPLWDGEVAVLQVVATGPTTIEVRGLATARNAPNAFDLRCDIRESVLADLVSRQPEALPRLRVIGDEQP